jgi:non-ribosomal peptide synthase protein (TIGR01720 family)
MNEHRGIYNRLLWMLDALPITQEDRVLQKTPYSFDVSIWEFFWPLLSGARLIIAKPGGHKDSDYLVNLIVEQGITAAHFVPSMLQVFLLNERVADCRSLKRVLCSGEALPLHLQEKFFSHLDAGLFNLYGPTEAAIEVTFWACKRDSNLSTVPIGRPIPNTQIHMLDADLQAVQDGEPGELHIGGVQVARGYLNLPELTAQKFIPDPFSTEPGAHLYKSGDLASYLPDGNILYLGRIDHQVKIRGNRVELGEIEATLADHPLVQASVVIAHEVSPGDNRLAAYIVTREQNSQSIVDLREFLSKRLPEYMIPASFTFLDRLPLTASGKVDRKALPELKRVRPNLSDNYVAPRNPIESALAGVWEQVIGLNRVGIYDHFLELGGDSIQCIQISSKALRAGIRLAPNQILELQTIAKLADMAGTSSSILAEQEIITGSLPLTPIQKSFIENRDPGSAEFNESLLLRVHKPMDKTLLEQVVKELMVHHDILRTRLSENENGLQQEILAPGEIVPFSYVDLSGLPGKDQEKASKSAQAELRNSLNLSDSPMLRVTYFDLGHNDRNYIYFIVHPLVIDNFSWGILLEHFDLAYQQLSQNKEVQLPLKTTSYKLWAQRLTDYAESEDLQKEVPYWLSRKEIEIIPLPVDHQKGDDMRGDPQSESVRLTLSEKSTRVMLTDVPKAYNTLITDILLSTLVETFSEWTGNTNLLVEIKGHGREAIFEDIDLSQTIGCFSAIYPVTLEIGDVSELGESLITIKEQLRGVPNGGIGYGVLRYLNTDDEIRQQIEFLPQAQLSFNYLGQIDNVLRSSTNFSFADPFEHLGRNSQGNPQHLLEITAGISDKRLNLMWTFRRNIFQKKTIENLAQSFIESLEKIIDHCRSVKIVRYTPSDFPEANLNQQELDSLLAEINEFED